METYCPCEGTRQLIFFLFFHYSSPRENCLNTPTLLAEFLFMIFWGELGFPLASLAPRERSNKVQPPPLFILPLRSSRFGFKGAGVHTRNHQSKPQLTCLFSAGNEGMSPINNPLIASFQGIPTPVHSQTPRLGHFLCTSKINWAVQWCSILTLGCARIWSGIMN